MFANQRCYTYIPWTPSTFLRSHCLIGLSFSWNVRLDSFVSLPGSFSERRNGVAQTSEAGRWLLKLVVCFTALLKFVGPWRSNLRSDGPSYLLFGKRGEKDASYYHAIRLLFFFGEREKRSPDASRVICSSLIKASVNGVIVSDFTGNSSCSEVG